MDRTNADLRRLSLHSNSGMISNEVGILSNNFSPSNIADDVFGPLSADSMPELSTTASSFKESHHEDLEDEWGLESPPNNLYHVLPQTEDVLIVEEPRILQDPNAPDSPAASNRSAINSDDGFSVNLASNSVQQPLPDATPDGSPGSFAAHNTIGYVAEGYTALNELLFPSRDVPMRDDETKDAATQTDLDWNDEDDGNSLMPDLFDENDAQRVLPPEGCLFGANLLTCAEDEDLKAELERLLKPYGTVFVKVRRDPTRLAIAFLQFTSQLDAMAVLAMNMRIKVFGRPLRLEQAKCERTLFCSHRSGKILHKRDYAIVRDIVSKYGAVERIWSIPTTDADFYNMPVGAWIRFRHYGSCQDAYKELHYHPLWQFELMRNHEPCYRFNPYPFSTILDQNNDTFSEARVSIMPARPPRDIGSMIVVEGLPSSTSPRQLVQLFGRFGTIRGIETPANFTFVRDSPADIPYKCCIISFADKYAGPAAWASCCRYGMSVQDASRGLWTYINVVVLYVNDHPAINDRQNLHHPFCQLRINRYHKYLRSLKHPAHAIGRRYEPGTLLQWTPTTIDFRNSFDEDQVAACAPLLGAPATDDQVDSFLLHTSDECWKDDSTGHWNATGTRTQNYGIVQGFCQRGDTARHFDAPIVYTPYGRPVHDYSGISPLR
ncbi:hypothetical protein K461DRAFT_322813 [Myriangium duriaei CBS 260.36]|uniref:RRM domain-containing protein n=1 Tax=Myriangium duriaei CBS 260.36 TaxID=1168546 RepID=A0A9P4IZ50_9PEZI|nr:hypothetical protein K461DRAFT_322813 [Myriangium duriaei CBS 260.36]